MSRVVDQELINYDRTGRLTVINSAESANSILTSSSSDEETPSLVQARQRRRRQVEQLEKSVHENLFSEGQQHPSRLKPSNTSAIQVKQSVLRSNLVSEIGIRKSPLTILLKGYYDQDYMTSDISMEPEEVPERPLVVHQIPVRHLIANKKTQQDRLRFPNYEVNYEPDMGYVTVTDSISSFKHYISGNVARCCEFDNHSGRYFLFDNDRREVIVRSIRFKDELCRFKTTIKRIEPILYYHPLHQLLFVAGGYQFIKSKAVKGSNRVEIFEIGSWTISHEPKIVRISAHRIDPTIISMMREPKPSRNVLVLKQDQLEYIIILGGHVYGDVQNKATRMVDYRNYQSENESNYFVADIINVAQIKNAFASQENIDICSLTMQVDYGGDFNMKTRFMALRSRTQSQIQRNKPIIESLKDVFQVTYSKQQNRLKIEQIKRLVLKSDSSPKSSSVRERLYLIRTTPNKSHRCCVF